uniref:Uncharacterized protein n=1 Tax=Rhizophora mucronata TaxID=61149 RepID=A0A2P2JK58_RHIMU
MYGNAGRYDAQLILVEDYVFVNRRGTGSPGGCGGRR